MIRITFYGIILFLASCSTIEDTLTLKKKPSGDEFLVEKKSPLVVPPEFGKLPTPVNIKGEETLSQKKLESENDIEKLLTNKEKISNESNSPSNSSIEETILKNIK